jgi:hypothetical protein
MFLTTDIFIIPAPYFFIDILSITFGRLLLFVCCAFGRHSGRPYLLLIH